MIIIVGAGLAGLLAARMLKMRGMNPIIRERQPSLPNNHHAVLRFRTDIVSKTLGIPFRRVQLIKDVEPWISPVADSLAYSYKNTGIRRSDRSITQGMVMAERYIAPPDLIEQMARDLPITYGTDFDFRFPPKEMLAVISTIPMPELMKALEFDRRQEYQAFPTATITARLQDTDAYVSLIVPNPQIEFSRVSITGDQLIVELPEHLLIRPIGQVVDDAVRMLGYPPEAITDIEGPHISRYGKILQLEDDRERKEFMFWATTNYNIYSLGRFATWRPGLLLDDLVQDIHIIGDWIAGQSRYDVAKSQRRG